MNPVTSLKKRWSFIVGVKAPDDNTNFEAQIARNAVGIVNKRGTDSKMLYRTLGSTGERVSAIGLGGWHLGLKHVDEQLALRIVRTAIDRGINFLDNCWDYNEGASEIRMGKAIRDGYREKAFLMTKIDGRTKQEAAKQLDESLERLEVDCIDLVQHHEIL